MWKLFGTILSIAAFKAAAETHTACTMEFMAQFGTVFAIPGSCEKYLACRSGRLIEQNCPAGMLFDVESSRCIGEYQAECLAESWSVADGLCESDGIFPDPHSCARFVICLDKKALPGQCSPGLLFDATDLRCVVPKDVRCNLRCPNYDEEQYLPDSTGQDCSRYYVCKDGIPHLAECPSMMYFDVLKKTCTLPENASCRIEGVVCSDYDEFVVNPKSCSSYYKCERGFPHLRKCGGGLDFVDEMCSISSEVCDGEAMNETENSTEIEPSTTNMTPTPEITTESSTTSSTLSEPQTSSTGAVTTDSSTTSEETSSTSSTPVELTTENITTQTSMTETPSTVTEQPSTTDSTIDPTTATQTEQPTTENSEATSTQEPSTEAPSSTTESSTATPETGSTESSTVTDSTTVSTQEPSTVAPSSTIESSTTAHETTPTQPSTESSTVTGSTTVSTQEPSTVAPSSTTESSTATPETTPAQPSTESSTVTVPTTVSTQEPSSVTPTEQPTPSTPVEPTTVTDVTLTTEITDSSTTEAVTPTEPSTSMHPPVDPAEMCRNITIGVVKHPYNCYQYFLCLFGAGVEATCSSEMIFHPNRLACVPGDRATCTPTD